MAENDKPSEPAAPTPVPPADGAPPVPPKRSPGHRGADVKDTVAEMAAKAHEISLEAGSKMAAAMKDVVNAAAGVSGFVIESARDLVQYMVRRGQMTQEEADKLIRQVEEHQPKRKAAPPPAPLKSTAPSHAAPAKPVSQAPSHASHAPGHAAHAPAKHAAPLKPAAKKAAAKPAKAGKPAKSAKPAKKPSKPAAKKSAPKKPAAKKPVAKKPVTKKPATKKPAAKKPANRK